MLSWLTVKKRNSRHRCMWYCWQSTVVCHDVMCRRRSWERSYSSSWQSRLRNVKHWWLMCSVLMIVFQRSTDRLQPLLRRSLTDMISSCASSVTDRQTDEGVIRQPWYEQTEAATACFIWGSTFYPPFPPPSFLFPPLPRLSSRLP